MLVCTRCNRKAQTTFSLGHNCPRNDCGYTFDGPCQAGVPALVTRKFESGTTRDTDQGKLDFEGFLAPRVVEAYARYMNFNRTMRDGSVRASDNWQLGMPKDVALKSLWRHFFDLWSWFRGDLKPAREPVLACCAILFNTQAILNEILKENPEAIDEALRVAQLQRDQEKRVTGST